MKFCKKNSQVDYYTEDGTALKGKDYIQKSGTLTFGPNETRCHHFLNFHGTDYGQSFGEAK